jgi:phosphate butyryltransferase
MTAVKNFQDIDALAVHGPPVKLAALAAHERECMLTIKLAFERGYVIPCLVGDPKKIKRMAGQIGLDLTSIEVIKEKESADIAHRGVEMLFQGEVDIASKGHIPTAFIYKSIIIQEKRLGRKKNISVNTLWEIPGVDHLISLTDTGVSITPNYTAKKAIIRDAVLLMHLFGYARPRITVLSAYTGTNQMSVSFQDAGRLKQELSGKLKPDFEFTQGNSLADVLLGNRGDAYNFSRVSYHDMPHIFLIPNLDAGNILSKLDFILPVARRSLVITSKGPVIIPSRSDTHISIVGEIALGVAVVRLMRKRAL